MESEDFEQGFEEYILGGISEENNHRYRCAINLYYKALCQLIDFLILQNTGEIIDSYKDRTEKVNELNSDIGIILKTVHNIYRGTYKTKKDRYSCKQIKDDIKKIIAIKKIKGKFEEIVKKI